MNNDHLNNKLTDIKKNSPFRSEKCLALLEGEVLELAQGRMEVFDELDAEIIG